ncbi:MAG: hypothetical protein IJW24_00300 [Clostridia bacterium]|nr:hypothetical protein [Clostridia bacterium]
MKITINNEKTKNKNLDYEETFWLGKRTIVYDNTLLTKYKGNLYEYKKDGKGQLFQIKGNQVFGVSINMFDNWVEISRKITWYEVLLALLAFFPAIMFGIWGGVWPAAICGGIGGGLFFTSLTIIRNIDKLFVKIIVAIEFMLIALLMFYIITFLIFKTVLPF